MTGSPLELGSEIPVAILISRDAIAALPEGGLCLTALCD